jgi:protein SFI1
VLLCRTRYLWRKYFVKWSYRVFGRVLPSVARQHSAHLCKKKVLMAWQEEWWVERKEWKLGIRAECHNRY